MKRRIIQELGTERPTIWIGKEGATPEVIDEINSQLKRRETIKAKILRTALKEERTRDIATTIATRTNSALIDVRGHTFMLYRQEKG